jgi:hypothetical protein
MDIGRVSYFLDVSAEILRKLVDDLIADPNIFEADFFFEESFGLLEVLRRLGRVSGRVVNDPSTVFFAANLAFETRGLSVRNKAMTRKIGPQAPFTLGRDDDLIVENREVIIPAGLDPVLELVSSDDPFGACPVKQPLFSRLPLR